MLISALRRLSTDLPCCPYEKLFNELVSLSFSARSFFISFCLSLSLSLSYRVRRRCRRVMKTCCASADKGLAHIMHLCCIFRDFSSYHMLTGVRHSNVIKLDTNLVTEKD